MKKIILILCIFLTSGCADYIEINDLCMISSIIMDYKDNQYVLNTQVIINEKESKTLNYETRGESIAEALLEISKMSDKELYIPHLKVLMISKNVILHDKNFYDYFLRNPKLKLNFHIFLVDSINEVIKCNENGLYITNMMKYNNEIFSTTTSLSFTEMIIKNIEYGKHNVYPKISVKDDKLYLKELVFFNDKNEEVILNDEVSLYYNILSNKNKNSIINIKCDEGFFSITLNKSNTDISYKNNTIYIDVTIDSKLNYYGCNYDINEESNIKKINKFADNYVHENINKLILLSKENKADILGFGSLIYKYTKEKENNYLDSLKYVINVNTNINSIGEKRS